MRHGAKEENLQINEEGYIKVSDILQHRFFNEKFTLDDIKRIVLTNDKQRFTLRSKDGVLEICANQGHSIGVSKTVSAILGKLTIFLFYFRVFPN